MIEKTAAQKLLIKPGQRVRIINPPDHLPELLENMPAGIRTLDDSASPELLLPADVTVLFANNRVDLETLLPGLRTALASDGKLWVAYHKGSSAIKTDINRDSINAYAHTIGLQGIAMVSINDDWSALRLKAN